MICVNEQVSGRLILDISWLSSSRGMWPHSTSTSGKISDTSIVLINTSCQGMRPRPRLAGHSEVPVPAAVRLQASRPLLLSATAADIPRCRDNGGLLHCRPVTPNSEKVRWCRAMPFQHFSKENVIFKNARISIPTTRVFGKCPRVRQICPQMEKLVFLEIWKMNWGSAKATNHCGTFI